MGWYADTNWDLTFNSEEALAAAEVEFTPELSKSINPPFDFPLDFIALFNEESDGSLDGLHLTGWGGGKAYDLGPAPVMHEWSPDYRPINVGGEDFYSRLAPFVTGTIDWKNDEGGHWRIRFKDGGWKPYDGEVTYPDDPGE